jgi:hypothetical protein
MNFIFLGSLKYSKGEHHLHISVKYDEFPFWLKGNGFAQAI